MASANEAGVLRIVAESPEGHQIVTHTYRSDGFINAGKSPDGVLANLTRDKWAFIPKADYPVLSGGWRIRLLFKLDAQDGLDASDGVIQIPLTVKGQGIQFLSAADLGHTVDFPASTTLGTWHELGTGYTVPNGQQVKIGGDYGVISVEDDG
jgi:hypothetical protein